MRFRIGFPMVEMLKPTKNHLSLIIILENIVIFVIIQNNIGMWQNKTWISCVGFIFFLFCPHLFLRFSMVYAQMYAYCCRCAWYLFIMMSPLVNHSHFMEDSVCVAVAEMFAYNMWGGSMEIFNHFIFMRCEHVCVRVFFSLDVQMTKG